MVIETLPLFSTPLPAREFGNEENFTAAANTFVTEIAALVTGLNTNTIPGMNEIGSQLNVIYPHIDDLIAAAQSIEDVSIIAPYIEQINAVAADIANIDTVSGAITYVNAVGSNIPAIVTAADNIDAIIAAPEHAATAIAKAAEAADSAAAALASETNAAQSESQAAGSAAAALASETNAAASEAAAAGSAADAAASADRAEAITGTTPEAVPYAPVARDADANAKFGTCTDPAHAANKGYVDGEFAAIQPTLDKVDTDGTVSEAISGAVGALGDVMQKNEFTVQHGAPQELAAITPINLAYTASGATAFLLDTDGTLFFLVKCTSPATTWYLLQLQVTINGVDVLDQWTATVNPPSYSSGSIRVHLGKNGNALYYYYLAGSLKTACPIVRNGDGTFSWGASSSAGTAYYGGIMPLVHAGSTSSDVLVLYVSSTTSGGMLLRYPVGLNGSVSFNADAGVSSVNESSSVWLLSEDLAVIFGQVVNEISDGRYNAWLFDISPMSRVSTSGAYGERPLRMGRYVMPHEMGIYMTNNAFVRTEGNAGLYLGVNAGTRTTYEVGIKNVGLGVAGQASLRTRRRADIVSPGMMTAAHGRYLATYVPGVGIVYISTKTGTDPHMVIPVTTPDQE